MIRVGTSGFSYPDWKGTFYPADLPRDRWLDYYAASFQALEVNFTYYRLPAAGQLAKMAERSGGLIFTVKAHRDMTHTAAATADDYAALRKALEPLAARERLGCVLAQFPWSFRPSGESREFIAALQRSLGPFPLVVEFRHDSWGDKDTFDYLRGRGIGFCAVDEPRLKGLMPPLCPVTSDTAYVRFHGRNARAWWRHRLPHERYDYLYTRGQLREWVPRIRAMDRQARQTFVFTNNHFEGKAAENARTLRELLAQPGGDPSEGL